MMSLIDLLSGADQNNHMIRNITFVVFTLFSLQSMAFENSQLRTFLVSCGYGTAIGAAVGAGSLAFTDDPGSKLTNIAKGASLGLYAGIGIGIYLNSKKTLAEESSDVSSFTPVISPLFQKNKIDGVQLQIVGIQF